MQRCKLKIYLKSGRVLKGWIDTTEEDTNGVAKTLFVGDENTINSIYCKNGVVFFNISEVEAFEIKPIN